MTTPGLTKIEIPGGKPAGSAIPASEFRTARKVHSEGWAGCHGGMREGATGRVKVFNKDQDVP